jgi:exopolysaccharide biosynthesis polyprenyl glycosylphosphotransferase
MGAQDRITNCRRVIQRVMDGAVASGAHEENFSGELTLAPRLIGASLATRSSRGSERWSVLRQLLFSADLIAAVLAGTIVALSSGLGSSEALAFALAVAAGWPLFAFVFGLYAADDLGSWASGVGEAPRMVVALLVLSWPLYAVAVAVDAASPVTTALVAVGGTALLSASARAGGRAMIHRVAPLRQRTVIVGSGQVAGQLVRKLQIHEQFGLHPIGIVDDELHNIGTPDLPHLGRLDDLENVLRLHAVDRVIIAFSRASHEQLLKSIRACRDQGVAVDVVPRLFEFLDGASRALGSIGGLPLLSISAPQMSGASRAAKRALDVAVSGAALLALSPVLAVVAVAIKLESRGPVFFRQVRAGRGGRVFRVYKFRSMYADAEQRKVELHAVNDVSDGVMFKMHRDPRVTRTGRLLRRLSLDELPQLINVLRGEMSLVGPRPLILPESQALEEAWHERRLDLRPGLTGPWQVSGRSDIPFQEMVRFDYQYVAGWSLARDIGILLATIPAVLSGRGAY